MPKQVDRAERRQNIVDATIRILVNGGMESLTMRSVAAEASATIGMLNYWFNSKEDLVTAALEQVIAAELDFDIETSLKTVKAFEKRLHSFLPLDEERVEHQIVWGAFEDMVMKDEKLRQYYIDQYELFRSLLKQTFKQLAKPKIDIELGVDHVLATIDGISGSALFEPGRWTPARQKKVLRQTLVLYFDI